MDHHGISGPSPTLSAPRDLAGLLTTQESCCASSQPSPANTHGSYHLRRRSCPARRSGHARDLSDHRRGFPPTPAPMGCPAGRKTCRPGRRNRDTNRESRSNSSSSLPPRAGISCTRSRTRATSRPGSSNEGPDASTVPSSDRSVVGLDLRERFPRLPRPTLLSSRGCKPPERLLPGFTSPSVARLIELPVVAGDCSRARHAVTVGEASGARPPGRPRRPARIRARGAALRRRQ
jgi:hypothetical protein